MNINLWSLNNIQLLEAAYNHIEFWSLAQKYKKEMKEAGKNKRDLDRGTVLRQRLRTPLKLVCTQVPKRLPIDFYNPSWFNDFPAGQKTIICDAFNVAFFPNASELLRGIQHLDEKLRHRGFTEKYWDRLIVPYDISHEIPQEEELKGLDGRVSDESEEISSDDGSEGENNNEYEEPPPPESGINKLSDNDTDMAHAEDTNCYIVSQGYNPLENKWSGW
ncbi:hypothetical protein O181_001923 [Austropuccinia psidii MF-1]|uniref:Uncharacterized protein n=1 Tax=Austropuccinia psidii MF-1 TaxID=1389203 RepID=A0A9Q3BBS0_9BASI|nr:hypothetical protein [Austropuccinia psidii MF-1]